LGSCSCDVLDDLLHIVNESLGRDTDDACVDSHTLLPDYDDFMTAALDDDDNSLIESMVVSPDSRVPACTTAAATDDDDLELAKIIDFSPEWSFIEVTITSYVVYCSLVFTVLD